MRITQNKIPLSVFTLFVLFFPLSVHAEDQSDTSTLQFEIEQTIEQHVNEPSEDERDN